MARVNLGTGLCRREETAIGGFKGSCGVSSARAGKRNGSNGPVCKNRSVR